MSRLAEEFRPDRLLPSLTAGCVGGIVQVLTAVSFAVLLFSDHLAGHVPAGIGIALFSVIVVGVIVALMSSRPGMVANLQEGPAAVLALVVAGVASDMRGATADEIFRTTVVAIALSSLLTGTFFFLLGVYRLGGLVRYIPYPVVGGFLAGSGWLLSRGALGVMTDVPLGLSTLSSLVQPPVVTQWLPGALYAVLLLVALRRFGHFLVMPAMLLGGIAVFYAALGATGTTMAQATDRGWLLPAFSSGGLWTLPNPAILGQVPWPAIATEFDHLAVVVVVSVLALLLNASAIELVVERDVDLNRELRAAGLANLVAGLGGGLVGFQGLGLSVLAHRMNAHSRLAGIIPAAICGAIMFLGASLLWLVPKPILGGLLLFLGLSLLVEWVYDAWFKLPRADYVVVLLILVIIGAVGFLEGVGVGVIVAVILFVVNYSRISVVKHALSGADQHSSVDRPADHRRLLREKGEQVFLLKLQGFIFFGTATRLLDEVRQRIDDARRPPLRYVVLDFHRVTGLDSSAVYSFLRMKQVARAQRITLVFTHLPPPIRHQLAEGAVLEEPETLLHTFADPDHGLEWCEDQILAAEDAALDEEHRSLPEQLAGVIPDAALVARLMAYLDRDDLHEGEYLIRQGEVPTYMYFIESGQLTVQLEAESGEAIRIGTRRAGTIVGELGLYRDAPRTASLVADRACTVHRLSGAALQRMEREDPEVASAFHRFMVRLLAERLADTTRTMQVLRD